MQSSESSQSTEHAAGGERVLDDPRLRLDLPVMDCDGRTLGRLVGLEHDPATRQLSAIVVRHGWRHQKHTRVPSAQLARISQGMLVLADSKLTFERADGCAAPAHPLRAAPPPTR